MRKYVDAGFHRKNLPLFEKLDSLPIEAQPQNDCPEEVDNKNGQPDQNTTQHRRQDDLAGIEIPSEYERVCNLIETGTPIVFVTGGAGTGKSTLIRYLQGVMPHQPAIVAPTGVAALNAGGATIHSFFQFPPKFIESADIKKVYNPALYNQLKLLIIDEISMVRPDVLDGIDQFLRLNRGNEAPFGGVQILLIGDLFQLPPVVSNSNEARALYEKYETQYFFSAHCLQEQPATFVELTKIYRQAHGHFTDLLNKIRSGDSIQETIGVLNHVCLNQKIDSATRLVLTPTNAVVERTNAEHLAKLEDPGQEYLGVIEGRFPKDRLPAPQQLHLKIGAQVMLTKNDTQGRWVNGTIGTVQGLSPDLIEIETEPNKQIIQVEEATWETLDYRHDSESDCIVAEPVGKYTQFPLKLAWAVTIHKSQGKTLDFVSLDLGRGVFAPGQLYVALSRCRTLEGIHLTRPIQRRDVIVDERVKSYYDFLKSQ